MFGMNDFLVEERSQVPVHHHFCSLQLHRPHVSPPSPSPPGRTPRARATLPLRFWFPDCPAKDAVFYNSSFFGKPLKKNQVGLAKVDSWSNRAGFRRSITAPRIGSRITLRRGRQCAQCFPKFLLASPSFHGGRGALPSAGGHPSDLTYLAGGGAAEA